MWKCYVSVSECTFLSSLDKKIGLLVRRGRVNILSWRCHPSQERTQWENHRLRLKVHWTALYNPEEVASVREIKYGH